MSSISQGHAFFGSPRELRKERAHAKTQRRKENSRVFIGNRLRRSLFAALRLCVSSFRSIRGESLFVKKEMHGKDAREFWQPKPPRARSGLVVSRSGEHQKLYVGPIDPCNARGMCLAARATLAGVA